jgi:uncharacterized surface protein with fasciclin (FAS1) repeats
MRGGAGPVVEQHAPGPLPEYRMTTSREMLNAAIEAAYERAADAARAAYRAESGALPDGGPPPEVPASAARRAVVSAGRRPPRPGLASDVLSAILQSGAPSGPFTILARAIRTATFSELPAGIGPFTLFAPTNRAFAKLPADQRDALFQDPIRLGYLLARHLVGRRVRAPRPGVPTPAMSVTGHQLTVTSEGGAFRVNGARVVKPHIHTANGTVHGIDTVLRSD